ncbi:hypothetical protein [Nostoc sp.]|uniref:hypothetical protein n=1 Tax=Nostoc sp. TaxID=1180 RepID=UPI002FF5F6E6
MSAFKVLVSYSDSCTDIKILAGIIDSVALATQERHSPPQASLALAHNLCVAQEEA